MFASTVSEDRKAVLEGDGDPAAQPRQPQLRTSWSSMSTRPESTSCRRETNAAAVDLPLPPAPTSATRSPGRMCSSKPASTGRSGV